MKIYALILASLLLVSVDNTARANDNGSEPNAVQFFLQDANKETVKVTKHKGKKYSVEQRTIIQRSGDLINKASTFMGATARQLGLPSRLWCADFMNMLVGGEDRRAISYASRGKPAGYGCVNCVAVTKRRGGNHVGIVKGYDENGNPIIISGNHNRKVGVGIYTKNRVVAYRYI